MVAGRTSALAFVLLVLGCTSPLERAESLYRQGDLRAALDETPDLQSSFDNMSPLGRMGTVEEVAAMALFLASDEASFCTGGQYPVEGGTVSEHPRML